MDNERIQLCGKRAVVKSILDAEQMHQSASMPVQAAAKGGRTFTDQEAKSILIRPIGGSAGILSYGRPTDSEGEANWARYRHLKYKAMSELELELLAASEGVYDLHAHYALHDLKIQDARFIAQGDDR